MATIVSLVTVRFQCDTLDFDPLWQRGRCSRKEMRAKPYCDAGSPPGKERQVRC